jgi:hypothetical protein
MAVIPAKAGIQYAAAPRFYRRPLGILDHPLSRMMTAMSAGTFHTNTKGG